jgi:hypothetical protein
MIPACGRHQRMPGRSVARSSGIRPIGWSESAGAELHRDRRFATWRLGLFRGRLANFLLVLGINSGAGGSTARGRNLGKDGYMPHSPQREITKFLAIGTSTGMTPEQRKEYMLSEITATMQLYLDGKIDQFWHRYDGKGVIFVMTTASKEEAEILLKGLPLGVVGVLNFELIPIGPLRPINALLEAAQKTAG